MIDLKFTDEAIRQINHQSAYFADNAPHIISLFHKDILEVSEQIMTHPESGRRSQFGGSREILSAKLKFVVVYEIMSDTQVDILRLYFRGQNRSRT